MDETGEYLIAPADHSKLGRIIRNFIFSICGRRSHSILTKFAQIRCLREIFAFIAFLGTEEGWSIIFVGLICCYKFYACLLGSYTLLLSFIVCNQIKSYFCLPRPEEGGKSEPNTKKYERCYDWSFPSLHVLSCTGVYLSWQHFFPGFNHAYFCILMIALSRLYFQVHHITDIVVGFFFGYLVHKISVFTFEPVINYPYASIPMFSLAILLIVLFPKQEPSDTAFTDIMCSMGIFLGFVGMINSWKKLGIDGGLNFIQDSKETGFVPSDGYGTKFLIKMICSAVCFPLGDLLQKIFREVFKLLAILFGLPHYSSSVIRRFERKQGVREDKHFKQGMLIPKVNDNMMIIL